RRSKQTGQGVTQGLSAKIRADVEELNTLRSRAARDPELHSQRLALAESLLRRLSPTQAPDLWAALLVERGNASSDLPTGDRAAVHQRAIAHYSEALRFYTPEAAPLDYALTQNNLGSAYRELPTGDRAANLQRAIAHYSEALRFYTPEAAPLQYAAIQNNLG